MNGNGHGTSILLTGDFDKHFFEKSFPIMHNSKYFVNKAVKDIHKRANEARGNYSNINRKDTVLFRLVLGGSVGLVRAILEYMRDSHMEEELAWATGVKQHTMNNNIYKTSGWRWFNHILRFITFLILWAIFAISTPVFYLLHAVICRITTKLSARISKKPKLPLVFAVLSGNVDMVKLFLQFGTTLDSCDSQGNNIYHYLADKSETDPEVFSRCHQLLKEVTDHSRYAMLLEMIKGRENEMGICPLEMLVMRGSIADFVRLSREEGCMGRLKMAVSHDRVTELSEDDRDSYVTCLTENSNVAKGPAHDMPVSEETDSLCKNEGQPGQSHYTEYEFDVTRYEQKDIYNKQSLLLQFMVHRDIQSMREADISSLLGSHFLQKWMLKKARSTGWCFWLKHAFHLAVTFVLLAVMVKEGGDMNDAPLLLLYLEHYIGWLMERREEYLSYLNGTITGNISIPLCPLSDKTVGGEYVSVCAYNILVKLNESCKLSDDLLTSYSFPTYSAMMVGIDSRRLLNTIMWCLILYVVVDFVQRSLFLGRNLFGKQSVRAGVTVVFSRLLPGSYVDAVLNLAMYTLFLFFYFIHTGYVKTYWESALGAFDHWDEFEARIEYLTQVKDKGGAYRDVAGHVFVGCLILRFIFVIHAVRLIPRIFFFIFTSKKMSIHLLEFGIVYGIITVIFALVFHFVMRDEKCPANKREEFETIASSIFVVYTLSIGGDNNNVFVETSNVNAKMAYTAYTVISVVLLLNLIIAIMTTTAEAVNQQPWKQALVSMEIWDEILGVEALFLSLYSPIVWVKNFIDKRRKVKARQLQPDRITVPVIYTSWSEQT